jgi:hypothetical protein
MKKSDSISFSETLKEPAYEHLWEVVHFLENARDEELFPEKYMAAQHWLIARKVKALYLENPRMPLNRVVITILSGIPESTSALILLELTHLTINLWEKQSDNAYAMHGQTQ